MDSESVVAKNGDGTAILMPMLMIIMITGDFLGTEPLLTRQVLCELRRQIPIYLRRFEEVNP
jgi:hypothetical protein